MLSSELSQDKIYQRRPEIRSLLRKFQGFYNFNKIAPHFGSLILISLGKLPSETPCRSLAVRSLAEEIGCTTVFALDANHYRIAPCAAWCDSMAPMLKGEDQAGSPRSDPGTRGNNNNNNRKRGQLKVK